MYYDPFSTAKSRNLIIGCDFTAIHSYMRNYSQDSDVIGFVYCNPNPPPITHFKGPSGELLHVYPLDQLEKVIYDHKIQRCEMQTRGIRMTETQSIINRIMSTGTCSIEFISPNKYSFNSLKPIIAITSVAPKTGKSQLGSFFCAELRNLNLKVSVIIPTIEILSGKGSFSITRGPHYEIREDDPIPSDFSDDDKLLIKNYKDSGACRIYVTSDYETSIIMAEQHSDIIIYDAKGCEYPTISVSRKDKDGDKDNERKKLEKFCVINKETLLNIREKSLWPGIFNLQYATNVVLISSENSESSKEYFKSLLKSKNIYFASIKSNCTNTDNDEEDNDNQKAEIESSTNSANSPNLDYILIGNLIDDPKTVIYNSNNFIDIDHRLSKYMRRYSPKNDPPPLKNHFDAQADILINIANASIYELRDNNNDSSNRETFCRLFLNSHLPPNYRVTSGEIIDSFSNGTGQLDVIIATDDCPIMTIDLSSSIIAPTLADDVLGVIEVKTTLNRDSLRKALNQLRPVKALMPMHKTLLLPNGSVINDPLDGKIITGIFSFEISRNITHEFSDEGSSYSEIFSILSEFSEVADFIVEPEGYGYFAAKTLKVCGINVDESRIVNGYVRYSAKGSGLALIFGILNSMAAIRRFSGSNCIRYLGGFWGGIEEKFLAYKKDAIKYLQRIFSYMANNGKNKEDIPCFRGIADMYYTLLTKARIQNTQYDNNFAFGQNDRDSVDSNFSIDDNTGSGVDNDDNDNSDISNFNSSNSNNSHSNSNNNNNNNNDNNDNNNNNNNN